MTAAAPGAAGPVRPEWTRGPDRRPPAGLLWELIVAQAARAPEAPAVRQWDAVLTYRELVEAASALAARLRALGVGPERRVGVCARRSLAMPVAVAGVLAAGGAYVALDPGHPARRVRDVLDDADVDLVVADRAGRALLAGSGRRLVRPRPADREPVPAVCPAGPDNAAYVLYTSGSTGRPKGVVVSHHSLASFVTATGDHFGFDQDCRAGAFAALTFDVSVLDLLTPLAFGGCVQLVPDDDRVDPGRLRHFLEAHQVTWGFVPPALLPLLDPDRLPHLADVVTAGEPPGPEQVARWSRPPDRRLHNWYGPTEATVCTVGGELTGQWHRPVPIGRPLAGCLAYVLDEQLAPCPPGVPGELYLGGPQVARGYWRRPGLTAERFLPDPFADRPGQRMYRTGDRVVWEPDGRIGFLGRLDRQVKVQGQRVEIGEVESVLRRHPRVRQAVVDVTGGGSAELVAFLTPRDAPDLTDLRDHCAQRLPGYMIPTRVLRLDTLPLTTSGKTDLAALRALAADPAPAPSRTREPSGGSVAAVVAEEWARVLPGAAADPGEDFLGCGGHSLRAMRLVAALRERCGRQVTVEDVYAAGTLAALTTRVAAAPVHRDDPPAPAGGPPRLSPAQQRMWFVERLAPDMTAHHVPLAERIRGPLAVTALRTALRAVATRHQVLRWRLPERDGAPVVEVAPPGEVPLPVVDLTGQPPSAREQALRELLDREAVTRFDLAAGPLWRARLVRLAAEEHVLVLTVHHLVFDGWSQGVLYRDLAEAYAAARAGRPPTADPPPAGFADYVADLTDRAARHGAEDLRWWVERLEGAPTVCDLPRDRPRPATQTFQGARVDTSTGPRTAAAVQEVSRRLGHTPYTVLLAAYAVLLRRLTGQLDLVVGVPYADRERAAFAPVVGLLLQILPVRLRVADQDSFADHVRRCGQEVRAAAAHRAAPLERVVEALRVPRDLSRGPLVQLLFNPDDAAQTPLTLPGCEVTPVEPGLPGSLFDLTLYVRPAADGFTLQAVYHPDLYDRARVTDLLDSYLHLLRELLADPDAPVARATARPPGARLPDWTTPLPPWHGPGVVEQVAATVAAHPDTPAVTGVGGGLTYRDLRRRWRRVAAAVRAAGLGAGDTVAVLATRHVTLPAQLLGVLAAGARWAVLDAGMPAARLAGQAAAADAKALLVCPGATPPPELAQLRVVDPAAVGGPAAGPDPAPPTDRHYLAFTSGTTGEPQAVLAPEPPLAHFLTWYAGTFGLGPADRFALLAGLGHDPLLRDVFTPLVVGAQLAVPEEGWLRDPPRLAAWLREQRVSVAHLTPQLVRMLALDRAAAPLPDLRLVATAGDQLTAADVARLRRLAPAARLVNFYGATETPQAHGWFEIPPDLEREVVPAGRGIDGSELVVVDSSGRPAAVGELGEIVVRSRHLAAGYLDPEPTRRRFGPTPGARDPRDRRYRTGDLGRHLPDGTVVVAGRADDQVKIRGYRVELGEVEAALAAHPDVGAAAALVTDHGGERAVRAFVAPAQPDVRADDLLAYLRTRLPEYAVPTELRLVPAIPLTANGKLDRRALAAAASSPRPRPSDELRTATERLVAEVWRSVLGRRQLGAEANFFDLGGHSLALVAVAARLSEAIGREVEIVDLFRFPTIRSLARFLDGDGRSPGLARAARRVAVRRERLRQRTTRGAGGAVDQPGGSPR